MSHAATCQLDRRLDAASRYVQSVHLDPGANGLYPPWKATVTTEAIGATQAVFIRYADHPSDAIDLALRDAAAWVQSQKDIK